MEKRNPDLQEFFDSVRDALVSRDTVEEARSSLARIFTALETPLPVSAKGGESLPVCAHLSEVLGTARAGSPSLARVAEAFEKLEPHLTWRRRIGGPTASENFDDGHANTMIAGPGAYEERDDIWIGATLMAPNVCYPDHTHKPEETYLVLSKGEFRQGDAPWFEPGIGGTLFNVPNIKHAMRSSDAPLFAVWCLWVDKQAG